MVIWFIAIFLAETLASGITWPTLLQGLQTLTSADISVGHVRFLSSRSAPLGSLDEVEITFQHIPDTPSGESYYAWLQISNDSMSPIHWLLPTQNGGISSSYTDPHLLENKPYLLLITVEKANTEPTVATFDPRGRLYYARLPRIIQKLSTFIIQLCPEGNTASICQS
jgi:hypothetical protein